MKVIYAKNSLQFFTILNISVLGSMCEAVLLALLALKSQIRVMARAGVPDSLQ